MTIYGVEVKGSLNEKVPDGGVYVEIELNLYHKRFTWERFERVFDEDVFELDEMWDRLEQLPEFPLLFERCSDMAHALEIRVDHDGYRRLCGYGYPGSGDAELDNEGFNALMNFVYSEKAFGVIKTVCMEMGDKYGGIYGIRVITEMKNRLITWGE